MSLPDRVLLLVFKQLKIDDLLQCKTICSNWYGIIDKNAAILPKLTFCAHTENYVVFEQLPVTETEHGTLTLVAEAMQMQREICQHVCGAEITTSTIIPHDLCRLSCKKCEEEYMLHPKNKVLLKKLFSRWVLISRQKGRIIPSLKHVETKKVKLFHCGGLDLVSAILESRTTPIEEMSFVDISGSADRIRMLFDSISANVKKVTFEACNPSKCITTETLVAGKELKKMSFENCPLVDDSMVRRLGQRKALDQVNFENCPITAEAITSLVQSWLGHQPSDRLTGCRIEFKNCNIKIKDVLKKIQKMRSVTGEELHTELDKIRTDTDTPEVTKLRKIMSVYCDGMCLRVVKVEIECNYTPLF